ncbi:MAG: hypothetical protein HYY67_03470 [Thaumarchaeota archaeon]|nr:hypothetical protein [Nitrososphaerota archaeon]
MKAQNKVLLGCVAGFVLAIAILGAVSSELPSQTAQIAYSPSAAGPVQKPEQPAPAPAPAPQQPQAPARASIVAKLPENKSLANAPAPEQAAVAAPEPPNVALQAPEAQQGAVVKEVPKEVIKEVPKEVVKEMPKDVSPVAPIYASVPLGVTDIVLPFLIAGVIAVSTSFLVKRQVERPEDEE